MQPEEKARLNIDAALQRSGWSVQDMKALNPSAGMGVAVREFPTDNGEADYILFVNGQPCGVIEAKEEKKGENLLMVEDQSGKYATSKLKWQKEGKVLPFVYESTGKITRFTDNRDPAPRSHEVFSFHRPETFADWLKQPETLRRGLQKFPELNPEGLRECQIRAITKLEKSFATNHPRALIQMATGSGKTFTAITSVYRLLKHAGAKRILFLVDTKNLGEQAEQEFQAFTPNDDKRKFNELYGVQRLSSSFIDKDAQVCISTIQRMYSILRGEELDESAEETSLNEIKFKNERPKDVAYNADVPPEFFDFIVIDECHRSIYNLWMQVLDYFDAFQIGLTATPDNRTYSYFKENVVSEYSHEDAVADGVNVGYDVYTIETEITKNGAVINAKEYVEVRKRLTREKRWEQPDEDITYSGKQLDNDIVNKSQIRQVIRTFKEKLISEIFPNRTEVPKTLIFAKSDSHANDIIEIVREEFAEGNDFCKKITYSVKDEKPSEILQSFRNRYNPRIAVTVDMIATGTDVKAIECLLFMRDVKSRNYFEQMKGRGTRTLNEDDLKKVTPSANGNKTHFVIIDAVGVCKSVKTDSRPLERKRSVPLKDLMMNIIMGNRDEDTVTSLAGRLARLERQVSDEEKNKIKTLTGGKSVNEIVHSLLDSYNGDVNKEIAKNESNPDFKAENSKAVVDACNIFNNPDLRNYIETCRKVHEQMMDSANLDKVLYAGFDVQAKEKAQKTLENFRRFLTENKAQFIALKIFYSQPFRRRDLTYEMIKELNDALQKPPYLLTTERIWWAYEQVEANRVSKNGSVKMLSDIISLLRFELGTDKELQPFAETVNRNFKDWIFKRNAQGKVFTEEQTEWLRMIKDHIITSVHLEKDDFDNTPFAEQGGLGKVWGVFDGKLDEIIEELNEALAA